jgi:uncharacterized membrane protein YbjE (DUF340 family)
MHSINMRFRICIHRNKHPFICLGLLVLWNIKFKYSTCNINFIIFYDARYLYILFLFIGISYRNYYELRDYKHNGNNSLLYKLSAIFNWYIQCIIIKFILKLHCASSPNIRLHLRASIVLCIQFKSNIIQCRELLLSSNSRILYILVILFRRFRSFINISIFIYDLTRSIMPIIELCFGWFSRSHSKFNDAYIVNKFFLPINTGY